jgi:hypothetical protein
MPLVTKPYADASIFSSYDTESTPFDHPIRSRQHIRWNGQTDLLGCLQVDSQPEVCRRLNRQIGWLRVEPDIAINWIEKFWAANGSSTLFQVDRFNLQYILF